MKNMIGWKVYSSSGKLLDVVYFHREVDANFVKDSLIDHDGYPANIIVYNSSKGKA